MKVYVLGGRAKWKDYVDLYFLLKNHFSLDQVSSKAEQIYGDLFSEHLLRQQLAFYEDNDYSEEVEFTGSAVHHDEIKNFLLDAATERF